MGYLSGRCKVCQKDTTLFPIKDGEFLCEEHFLRGTSTSPHREMLAAIICAGWLASNHGGPFINDAEQKDLAELSVKMADRIIGMARTIQPQ